MKHDETSIERRHFLRATGAVGLSSLFGSALAAAPSAPPGPVWQAGSCTFTPSSAPGPFYLNLALLRRDITEGKIGLPLELIFKVIRQSDCMPIAGVVVDVWHADALGRYSGIAAQGTLGQTFLRGIQITPASGVVHFRTIFPGWYLGRATHMHLKVNPTQVSEFTTQLYFPNQLVRSVDAHRPYDLHGQNPLANEQDAFYLPETVLPTFRLGLSGILGPFAGPRSLIAGLTVVIA